MLPKTQDILKPKFIEVRLHTDLTSTHPNYEKFAARITEVRDQYLGKGNIGLPQYLILDPNNPDKPIARKGGGGGGVEAFQKFFKRALTKAGG